MNVKAGSVDAEHILGTTITGKTISGGSINIGNGFEVKPNGDFYAKNGILDGETKVGGLTNYSILKEDGLFGTATSSNGFLKLVSKDVGVGLVGECIAIARSEEYLTNIGFNAIYIYPSLTSVSIKAFGADFITINHVEGSGFGSCSTVLKGDFISDYFYIKETGLAKFTGITTEGNINNYTPLGSYAWFNTKWADNSTHGILFRDSDGLNTYIGWDGSGSDNKSYTTTLVLRGSSVKLKNSSGTTVTSDERLKNSFKSLDEFDDMFMELQPCAFKYNNGTSGRYHFGFKAQNVRDVFLKHGYTTKDFGGFVQWTEDPNSEDYCGIEDPMGLIYTEFEAWSIRMVQKAHLKITKQVQEINELKKELEELRNEIKGS